MPGYHHFTRCCWDGSVGNVAQNSRGLAGGLRSGLSTFGPRLSQHERVVSFTKHIASFTLPYLDRAHATALVSTSSRLIDTLKRAFDKVYDGEHPESVYVVFIRVPQDNRPIVHSAWELARQAGVDAADRFKYEFLFEYEVPRKYAHHAVTVATLMDRGLKLDGYSLWDERSDQRKLPGTASLTQDMAEVDLSSTPQGIPYLVILDQKDSGINHSKFVRIPELYAQRHGACATKCRLCWRCAAT